MLKFLKKVQQDPLTSRDTEGGHTKRPHFRKTKSLEKLRNQQRMQNTKKYSNFFVLKERQFDSKEKSHLETFDLESRVRE